MQTKSKNKTLTIIDWFFDELDYSIINSLITLIQENAHNFQSDYFLFSYNGLPERYLKSLCTFKLRVCVLWEVTFQSCLGRTAWIHPYTDHYLVEVELAKKRIKKLVVICPSFVADCLETLEEIGIWANAQWKELGGGGIALNSFLKFSSSMGKGSCRYD